MHNEKPLINRKNGNTKLEFQMKYSDERQMHDGSRLLVLASRTASGPALFIFHEIMIVAAEIIQKFTETHCLPMYKEIHPN